MMTDDQCDIVLTAFEAIIELLKDLPWATRMTVHSMLVANELRTVCEGSDRQPLNTIWLFDKSLELALKDEQSSSAHLN